MTGSGSDPDPAIRFAAFRWLTQATDAHGDVLPRTLLEQGFDYEGERITLIGPQGIWKPRRLALPLSITTTAGGPYADSFAPDGLLAYKYRGADPDHPDNAGLRIVMAKQLPLIY